MRRPTYGTGYRSSGLGRPCNIDT